MLKTSGAAYCNLLKGPEHAAEVIFEAKGTPDQLHRLQFEVDKCTGKVARDADYVAPPPSTFECSVCFGEFLLHDGVACVDFEETSEDDTSHSFCTECIRGNAVALSDPSHGHLASGGIGLRCMEGGCGNVLLLSKFWLCI